MGQMALADGAEVLGELLRQLVLRQPVDGQLGSNGSGGRDGVSSFFYEPREEILLEWILHDRCHQEPVPIAESCVAWWCISSSIYNIYIYIES